MTGSSGLLGSALASTLRDAGERVVRLVRRAPQGDGESFWNPAKGLIDPAALEGARLVVHLAGAGLADRRWTAAHKREIMRSRVEGTRLLAETLAALSQPPRALLSASGIHYYGDTGESVVDESAPKGAGFLPDVVAAWEDAAEPAARAGIRVVFLRTSMVLTAKGGSLARMLPIFRLGLGAPLGSGRQYWSWISIDDWVGAVQHIMADSEISGPVNLTSPEPVTNRDFTRALGRAIHRPTMPIPVPSIALRLALGEFAREGVLSGPRAIPGKLLKSGYSFHHQRLDPALSAVL